MNLLNIVKKLTQSHYILAEEVSNISTQAEPKRNFRPKEKTTNDFLEEEPKSTIKKNQQKEQERQVAQELNLTRITE